MRPQVTLINVITALAYLLMALGGTDIQGTEQYHSTPFFSQ